MSTAQLYDVRRKSSADCQYRSGISAKMDGLSETEHLMHDGYLANESPEQLDQIEVGLFLFDLLFVVWK